MFACKVVVAFVASSNVAYILKEPLITSALVCTCITVIYMTAMLRIDMTEEVNFSRSTSQVVGCPLIGKINR